jgi:hypothetical protein
VKTCAHGIRNSEIFLRQVFAFTCSLFQQNTRNRSRKDEEKDHSGTKFIHTGADEHDSVWRAISTWEPKPSDEDANRISAGAKSGSDAKTEAKSDTESDTGSKPDTSAKPFSDTGSLRTGDVYIHR